MQVNAEAVYQTGTKSAAKRTTSQASVATAKMDVHKHWQETKVSARNRCHQSCKTSHVPSMKDVEQKRI
jgi:hypothetical protein